MPAGESRVGGEARRKQIPRSHFHSLFDRRNTLLGFAVLVVLLAQGAPGLPQLPEPRTSLLTGPDTACQSHTDCPGQQICIGKERIGECRCPSDTLLWKWSCYPIVLRLSSACLVSPQCSQRDPHRHCSPITKTCECLPGFDSNADENWLCDIRITRSGTMVNLEVAAAPPVPVGLNNNASAAITEVMEPPTDTNATAKDHTSIIKHIVNQVANATLVAQHSDNIVPVVSREVPTDGHHRHSELNTEQIFTLVYIGMALLGVFTLGLISAVYVRSMRDKRRNQATLRGLMDIMTGQSGGSGDTNSVVGYEHQDSSDSSVYPVYAPSSAICGNSDIDGSGTLNSLNMSHRRQTRLLLEPMTVENPDGSTEQIAAQYPVPHMSNPILPPIRAKRRQHKGSPEDVKYARPRPKTNGPDDVPLQAPRAISAISQSLTALNNRFDMIHNTNVNNIQNTPLNLSVASFPDDGPIYPHARLEEVAEVAEFEPQPPDYNDIMKKQNEKNRATSPS